MPEPTTEPLADQIQVLAQKTALEIVRCRTVELMASGIEAALKEAVSLVLADRRIA